MAKKKEWLNFWVPIGFGILCCGTALKWPAFSNELIAVGLVVIISSLVHQICRLVVASVAGLALGALAYLALNVVSPDDVSPTAKRFPLFIGALDVPWDFSEGTSFGGIPAKRGYGFIELVLENRSSEVYKNLSVLIKPEYEIIDSRESSKFSDCRIGPAESLPSPFVISGRQVVSSVPLQSTETDVSNSLVRPVERLVCSDLPIGSIVKVYLATVSLRKNPTMSPMMWLPERHDPRTVEFLLQYSVDGTTLKDISNVRFPSDSK